ncbi:MAG TPA: LON peptidase substrate-binding domain-containing protein [Acidimicrobiales bacterium]
MPLPMFPLGTVLFPTVVLPLHVFEPRYRALTRDCLAGGREFGVVLIERGSEVGGGDVRTDVGCVARIAEASELDDGRWVLAAVGTRRIRVTSWLPDDPYPMAEVEDWEDGPAGGDLDGRLGEVVGDLRRVLALAAELGRPAAPATVELSPDPALATFQAAAVAPVGPADRQRLLAAPGPSERLDLLAAQLVEQAEVLTAQLRRG